MLSSCLDYELLIFLSCLTDTILSGLQVMSFFYEVVFGLEDSRLVLYSVDFFIDLIGKGGNIKGSSLCESLMMLGYSSLRVFLCSSEMFRSSLRSIWGTTV